MDAGADVRKKAEQVVERVASHLRMHKPFYGALLCRLKVRAALPHEGIATAATDGRMLVYDPAFVLSRSFDDLVFIWVHEITHNVLGHPSRCKPGRDPGKWNDACDHATNLTLKRDPALRLPTDAVCDPIYTGMLAEEIYACIMRDQKKQEQAAQDQQQKEEGSDERKRERKSGAADDDSPEEAEAEQEEAADGGDPQEGAGAGEDDEAAEEAEAAGAGGSADDSGASAEAQPVAGAAGSDHGDVVAPGSLKGGEGAGIEPEAEQASKPAEAMDEAESKALAEEWAEAAVAASMVGQGEEASAMMRALGEILSPARSYEEEIERFMVERVRGTEDWSRSNRRFSHVYLPSQQSRGAKAMVYIIDTSGSVGGEDIARMQASVQRLSEELRVQHSIVIYADAIVQGIEEYFDEPPRFDRPKGGGGTRFDPALQRVIEMQRDGVEIAGAIYLTDQMGSLMHAEDYAELPLLWLNVDRRFLRTMPVGEACAM